LIDELVFDMDKIKDLRQKTDEELKSNILELKKEIFASRVYGRKSLRLRGVRRQIARILGLLNERKIVEVKSKS
jgi:ribosomal protein L29